MLPAYPQPSVDPPGELYKTVLNNTDKLQAIIEIFEDETYEDSRLETRGNPSRQRTEKCKNRSFGAPKQPILEKNREFP